MQTESLNYFSFIFFNQYDHSVINSFPFCCACLERKTTPLIMVARFDVFGMLRKALNEMLRMNVGGEDTPKQILNLFICERCNQDPYITARSIEKIPEYSQNLWDSSNERIHYGM